MVPSGRRTALVSHSALAEAACAIFFFSRLTARNPNG